MSEIEAEFVHLDFAMRHEIGPLKLDVAFQLTQPWTILFGPSGSGKSSILRAIAGLFKPQQGRIVVHQANRQYVLTDTASGVFIPPHQRPVRGSAQRPALFPHMTVQENLTFACEVVHTDWEQAVDHALDRFHLRHIAQRRPMLLSGGEQQRVSVARAALAANGRLLLLDEPFTGLDIPLRDELLADLQLWRKETDTPVLSVTHDIAEAFQLDAEVLKLREGRIVRQGSVHEVLAEERTRLLTQLEVS